MKVLFLKEDLGIGGAERQLALTTKYLPAEWERRVWTMAGGPFADVIAAQGHRVYIRPRAARMDVRPAWDLWRLLWDWRPDVVHSWDWMASSAALPLCAVLRIPVIDGTIRAGFVEPHRPGMRRLCMTLSQRVIANSMAGLLAYGVPAAKGRVVYNGFDPERLALCEAKPERHDSATVVVMTGRMTPQKDFSTVIRAARNLDANDRQRWRFVLVGYGPDRQRLLSEARDLTERGVTTFIDPGPEALPAIREADIGVLMTDEREHREGCSNALMEYMACGLPVICTRGGGNPELVLDGETGYLIDAGSSGLLVERLRGLAENPEVAHRMGVAGRRRLMEQFSTERMLADLLDVYREVAAF